ncbi:MAG: STAS domain-containing protein [Candidatus Omnitrophica bacterium]|nr:STAS domain-containing protein [Candidatus Omnitrophota bacterium]MBU4488841.1 STAS domain-containing protein [Candidatus Omnitrophota bacterium]MCG2705204.1 STAS domain-containing protein [Candidatus Omnitrophota bacterium]
MMEGDKTLFVSVEKKVKSIVEGVYLVKAKGRIDSDTYTILDKKIKPILLSSTKLIILDMEYVDYISSAGLSVIFQAKKIVEGNNGSLIIVSLQPQIKKVFEVMKALPSQNIFRNMAEVDAYLDMVQKREIEKQREKML